MEFTPLENKQSAGSGPLENTVQSSSWTSFRVIILASFLFQTGPGSLKHSNLLLKAFAGILIEIITIKYTD